MLRKIIILISALLIAGASAENAEKKYEKVQKTLDNIMAKAGISISGDVKSQYFYSGISGDAVDSSKRQTETNEFTSVDFDIQARPNEAVSARVMFRMHQNWQNFFSDISNPIFSRWISIDGNPLGMFRFSVGDFKEKYSPLTLYSPEVDVLYEPYIFKRQRELAMNELFIGDNYRVLQGINVGFDAEVAPIFDEFHVGLIGSRLATANSGENITAGSMVAVRYQNTLTMSKYFTGVNLDMTFLKGISLGGSWLTIFDRKGSYVESKTTDTIGADTSAQLTSIISLRPEISISKTFGMSESFTFDIGAELAFSNDDSNWCKPEEDKQKPVEVLNEKIKGSAISLNGKLAFEPSERFGVTLKGAYIANDKSFKNTLAQSPTFYGQRVMNFESDMIKGSDGTHYSTFDALYHSVFKFAPSSTGDWWNRTPMMKNSYYRGIVLDQNNLYKFMSEGYDPSVQLVMPLGPATPNRAGINTDIKLNVLGGIEATGLLSILSEKESWDDDGILPKSKFSQMGMGLKISIDKLASVFEYPFDLSASVVKSTASNDGYEDKKDEENSYSNWEITSSFTNFGLYYKFWKRIAFLGGYQMIKNTADTDGKVVEQTQNHWSLGLEWKVSDGVDVVTSLGQISAKVDSASADWNYGKGAQKGDFKQFLADVSLRVKF